ncbi:MAG: hypothetical protein KUL83_10930 [Lentimicrobium sp.]|nr:hypothetical protein [Lentimicrobium sp.]HAH56630.1 hypothetical protein [Bacteroidales bacterium]
MKKLNFLLMALIMSVTTLFVTSCSDDDDPVDPGPSLTLKGGADYTSTDATIEIGTVIKVGVIGNKSSVSGNKLTRFKVDFIANNIPNTIIDTTLNADSFNWDRLIAFNEVGEGNLSFQLTDKGGMTATKTFTITIEDPGSQINKYMDIEFGSWDDVNGSFFSSSEGLLYTVGQTKATPANQAKIDFVFFKGVENGNALASPDNPALATIQTLQVNGWTVKNQTRFNTTNISVSQFDAIGDSYSFPNFNLSGTKDIINQLVDTGEMGRVFLFKTKDNKLGLVKIDDLYSRGDRAKVDVIVQK